MNVVCFDHPVVSMISSYRYAVNVMWARLYICIGKPTYILMSRTDGTDTLLSIDEENVCLSQSLEDQSWLSI